ncbi:MAG: tRNA (adenosine(37)-N6)-dimethylallyltransferase MiaA [Candidatus Omnitrophica bacterium]|nr:tRNA (adenosine(37)-N6)-dimethylallyltransferase MiaA [Candidatus Omnitrophota bacterium]
MAKKKILIIVGPSATGKTKIGIYLAKKLNGSIVSADSMQVYRGMDIGTAKPSAKEREAVPHYLIDIISPSRSYSVYEWRKSALEAIQDILEQGRLPIVVGGSGLYIQSLIEGLAEQTPENSALRKKLSRLASTKGLSFLYERLKKIDPKSAKNIHPNDKKRLIRALEIYEATGKSKSQGAKRTGSLRQLGYSFRILGVEYPREVLYRRTDSRIDSMIHSGLAAEAGRLRKKRLSKTSRFSIGYREILEHLKGKMTLAEAVALIKKNTRHFVKRQHTWFGRDKRIRWIHAHQKPLATIYQEIRRVLRGWM